MKNNLNYAEVKDASKKVITHPIVKGALFIGGTVLLVFVGGLIMRVIAHAVIGYKMLNSAIRLNPQQLSISK